MNALQASVIQVALPAGALHALRDATRARLSPAESADLLREVGYETGQQIFNLVEERAGSDPRSLPPGDFWERLADLFQELGWGRIRQEELHPAVVSLESADWVEAAPGSGSAAPTCHIGTGTFAGLLSTLAGSDLAAMEVACRSRGDESCRFLVGSESALEEVYAGLRSGTPYTETIGRLGG